MANYKRFVPKIFFSKNAIFVQKMTLVRF